MYPDVHTVEANQISAIDPERNFLLFISAMAFWLMNVCYIVSLYRERHVRTPDVTPLGVGGSGRLSLPFALGGFPA